MGAPALKLEPEESVEERLARLESDVQHMQSDITDIKGHLLRVDGKIDALAQRTSESIAALIQSISQMALSHEKSISKLEVAVVKSTSNLKVWWMLTLTTTISGILARAFKWI
jgi:DNA anti-recombination protein RmuC